MSNRKRKINDQPEAIKGLMDHIGITFLEGTIAVASDRYIVYIYKNVKKPPVIKWLGWPVEYRIGIGEVQALANNS